MRETSDTRPSAQGRAPTRRLLAIVTAATVAASLALVACSGDDGGGETAAPTITAAATATATSESTATATGAPTEAAAKASPAAATTGPTAETTAGTDVESGLSGAGGTADSPRLQVLGLGRWGDAIYTPGGDRLLVTAPDKLLLYPADDIEAEPDVVPVEGTPAGMAYSPDGSRLAVGFEDGDVEVLDAGTFDVQLRISEAVPLGWAGILAFSPDAGLLAVGHDIPSFDSAGTVAVYDLTSGEAAVTIPDYRPTDFTFSPDGSLLVGAQTTTEVTSWDTASWEQVASVTLNDDPFQGDVGLLFDADGAVLYAAENKAGVFILAPDTLAPTGPLTDESGDAVVNLGRGDLALAPDEDVLYVYSTRPAGFYLFDTTEQVASGDFDVDHGGGYVFDLSPDGASMAVLYTSSSGVPDQRLEVWDVATAEQQQASSASTLASVLVDVSPDGTEVVGSHADQQVMLWDLDESEPVLVDELQDTSLAYFTAAGDGIVVGAPDDSTAFDDDDHLVVVRTLADGSDVAVGDLGFVSDVAVISSGAPVMKRLMAYDRENDRVAVVAEGVLSVSGAADGEPLYALEDVADALAVAFSPEGSVLALVREDSFSVHEAGTGDVVAEYQPEDLEATVALSDDGERVAVIAGSLSRSRVRVYQVGEEEPLVLLDPGSGAGTALAFDSSGDIIGISTEDTIALFDIEADDWADVIDTGARLYSMAFAPDDSYVVGGTADGRMVKASLERPE